MRDTSRKTRTRARPLALTLAPALALAIALALTPRKHPTQVQDKSRKKTLHKDAFKDVTMTMGNDDEARPLPPSATNLPPTPPPPPPLTSTFTPNPNLRPDPNSALTRP